MGSIYNTRKMINVNLDKIVEEEKKLFTMSQRKCLTFMGSYTKKWEDVKNDILPKIIVQPSIDIEDKKINPDKWIFIVFQDEFFSSSTGSNAMLDTQYIKYVLNKIKGISALARKAIFVINFSHEFSDMEYIKENMPYLLDYDTADNIDKNRITEIDKQNSKKIIIDIKAKKNDNFQFSNYSLVINNGKIIAIYRKSTYQNESENLLSKGYKYQFGDFKVRVIDNSPIGNILFGESNPLCKIFICADLQPKFSEIRGTATNITIVQSASFSVKSIDGVTEAHDNVQTKEDADSLFANSSVMIQADNKEGGIVGVYNSGILSLINSMKTYSFLSNGTLDKFYSSDLVINLLGNPLPCLIKIWKDDWKNQKNTGGNMGRIFKSAQQGNTSNEKKRKETCVIL